MADAPSHDMAEPAGLSPLTLALRAELAGTSLKRHLRFSLFGLFCNHFIMASERIGDRALSIRLEGGETCKAMLSIMRVGRAKLPRSILKTARGTVMRPHHVAPDRIDYHVPASGRLILARD